MASAICFLLFVCVVSNVLFIYLFFTFILFHENVEPCIYWYAVLEFVKEVCFASADSYAIALEMRCFIS